VQDPKIPPRPSTPIGEFSDIRTKSPESIKKVLDEWTDYAKLISNVSKLTSSQIHILRKYEREIRSLQKFYVNLNKAQGEFAQGMTALATKMGKGSGVGASMSRLTGTAAKLFSKIDEGTGTMKFFDIQSAVTAGKFMGYLSVVQIVVGAIFEFIEVTDKARIKQAQLMKTFGAMNSISVSTPYEAHAKGLRTAGEAGAEAAKVLLDATLSMRDAEGKFTFNPGTPKGGAQFEQAVKLTTGILPKLPEYLLKMRTVFAKKPSGMMEEITNIAAVAYEAQVPVEQLVSQIFAIGEEFAAVGGTAENAAVLVSKYADAIGNSELPMQTALNLIKETERQLRTAGGQTDMFKSIFLITDQFSNLSTDLQQILNTEAKKQYGDEKDFKALSIMQQADLFTKLSKDQGTGAIYHESVKQAAFKTAEKLAKEQGWQIARAFLGAFGYEIESITALTEKGDPNKEKGANVVGDAMAAYVVARASGDEKEIQKAKTALARATRETEAFAGTVAEMQKGIFSDFMAAIAEATGGLQEFGRKLRGGSQGKNAKDRAILEDVAEVLDATGQNTYTIPGALDVLHEAGWTKEEEAEAKVALIRKKKQSKADKTPIYSPAITMVDALFPEMFANNKVDVVTSEGNRIKIVFDTVTTARVEENGNTDTTKVDNLQGGG